MKNPFTALFRARDKPQDSVSAAPTFYFGTSGSGKAVNAQTAIQLSTVYACVRVISETVASLPLGVYEAKEDGNRKATEHPLYRLIHDEPNSEMTSFVLREVMLAHLLLWGNSYCQIIRTGRNKITGLYPLLPDKMTVDRDKNGILTYTYMTNTGQTVVLSPEDVLHIPGLGFDGVMGYSPIALEKNAIGLGIASEEYGSKFFSNGARPSGILTHPNTVKNPKALRESWNAAYGGSSNANRVAILEEGMKFEPMAVPNNEAQFLETRKFQVDEICRIFRVPPHLVGDLEHATFSNIEHMSIDFAVHTIRPWLVRIEQAMNRALFTDQEKGRFYVQFNIDGLMRGDYKSRMEGYAIARQNGWMSANDIRALENQNPIPADQGGDAYLVNGNMIPITTAMKQQTDDATRQTQSERRERMSLRLAGAGRQVGLSEAQILGFAAALSSVGIESQMGGSAFSKALIKMEVAAATGGDALEDFARVSGMSASQFKDLWGRDAASAFQAFIVGLSKMDEEGVSAIKTLDDIGIAEIRLRDTLLRATNASELFNKTQATANKAWSENAALTNEANKRYATTKSRLTNLKNTALMFARQIGDETPFLVKWFIEHGIEVWSTREGEQKLDNQVDRLLNFMRYWAASGESEKTSIRVKAAHTQMTQDGIWRGGNCPYGYKLVHNGRVGKKNRQLFDLAIDEVTGPIVMELFELVSTHGYGTQRAANYMNDKYPDPNKIWTRQTVLSLIRNPIYTGRLHMNDIRSEPIEELRLISDEEFDFVAKAIEGRIPTRYREIRQAEDEAMPEDAPTKASVYGASLLSGILYCGHCGCKLVGGYCTKQRGGKAYHRPIYRCYNSAIKAKGCTGQTVYSAAKIEEAVLDRVSDYFREIRHDVDSAWKENARKRLRDSAKARQKAAEARLVKLQTHQGALKAEIMKSITGESTFDTDLLKEMMEENKQAQVAAEQEIRECQDEIEEEEIRIAASAASYKNIQDWAAKFEGAPLDIKKMILARMIERITVDRDYNIEIHFYVTVDDFDGKVASAS